MVLGRGNELKYLNNAYANVGSQLIILYGQKYVGKTTLINDFIKDKDSLYYLANEASERQQRYLMANQLRRNNISISEYPEYDEIFKAFADTAIDKKVLVIDEFDDIVKAGSSFMDAILKLLHHEYSDKQFLIILCSSSIGFVENTMVQRIGKAAFEITGFLKIKELKFADVIKNFPEYSVEDCIIVYSILGGIPGLWKCFDPSISVRDNICLNILANGSFLKEEGSRYVKEELREGAVYYSILAALASGKQKLNDLYLHTGFSRAKISVYLKNLMELEIVEKVFSIDTPGRDNLKKGVYRISNHFVHFWFRFLYSNLSNCITMSPELFYDTYIAPSLREYCDIYFSNVCREYMLLSDQKHTLPINIERFGMFDGKAGVIDFIGQSKDGHNIIAFSNFSKPMLTYTQYENYIKCIQQAKIKPDYIYLFSNGRFDEKLTLEAKVKETMKLIGMDEL